MQSSKLTPKQVYVLANIDRVIPLVSAIGSERPRYQLDGHECTAQITGLVVKKWISKRSEGGFQRLGVDRNASQLVGERQAPSPEALAAIRSTLLPA